MNVPIFVAYLLKSETIDSVNLGIYEEKCKYNGLERQIFPLCPEGAPKANTNDHFGCSL